MKRFRSLFTPEPQPDQSFFRGLSGLRIILPVAVLALTTTILSWLPHSGQAQAAEQSNTPAAPDLELVGHLGGEAGKVVVEGNYAYLAQGIELTILDISDPATPYRLGYYLLPGFIKGLDVDNGYAYVGWGQCDWWFIYTCSGGLKILDISDPVHPFEVSSYGLPNSGSGLTVAGKYAYVLWQAADSYYHSWGGLKILDIADPAAPAEVGSVDFTNFGDYAPLSIAVANGYGYIVDYYHLKTFDLTDPADPTLVDSIERSGVEIQISNDYAYVVGSGGLDVVSLADPAHPFSTGYVGVDGSTQVVAVQGRYAYLAEVRTFDVGGNDWVGGGLRVIDVISPTAPVEIAYLPLPYGSRGVAVSGNLAYVAEVYNGLSVVDISTPTDPQEIGNYSAPGEVEAVVTTGSHVYSAAGYSVPDSGGLWTINVSNRSNPVVSGYYEVLDSDRVSVEGNHAYMLVSYYANMKFNNYLHVVDISNPAQPTGVSSYPLPTDEAAFDLDASNGYVYVAQTKRLVVVDVRNPTAPVTTDVITATNAIYDVAVSGAYAYVSDGSLRVFDLGDPAHPVEIGFLPLSGYVSTLAVSGQHVYIAGGTGLYVVDVSDPAQPFETGSATIASGHIYDIAAADGFAFLAADDAGLRVIDASDPAHPFETAFYTPPQIVVGVYTTGGYVYAAGWRSGLYIFRFNPLIHEIFLPLVMK
jgi:hypothetical protein